MPFPIFKSVSFSLLLLFMDHFTENIIKNKDNAKKEQIEFSLIKKNERKYTSEVKIFRDIFKFKEVETKIVKESLPHTPTHPPLIPVPPSARELIQFDGYLKNGNSILSVLIVSGQSQTVAIGDILLNRFKIVEISADQVVVEENNVRTTISGHTD